MYIMYIYTSLVYKSVQEQRTSEKFVMVNFELIMLLIIETRLVRSKMHSKIDIESRILHFRILLLMNVYFLYVFRLSLKYQRTRAPLKLSKANLPCRPFFLPCHSRHRCHFRHHPFHYCPSCQPSLQRTVHETFSRRINKILKGLILTLPFSIQSCQHLK